MPLWVYSAGEYAKVKNLWVYSAGEYVKVKNLWIYTAGEWKKVNMERKITNFTFPTLKSDTTKYQGYIWNNHDMRTGTYDSANYQGFAFGKPSKATDGHSIGKVNHVSYVKFTLTRNTGSGGDYGGTMYLHYTSHGDANTPPRPIPSGLSSDKVGLAVPNRGASKTYEFKSGAALSIFKQWLNSSGALCLWTPNNTNVYSGYTSFKIEEIRFT